MRVYAEDLPQDATLQALTHTLSAFGPVQQVKLIRNERKGKLHGFGTYENVPDAMKALGTSPIPWKGPPPGVALGDTKHFPQLQLHLHHQQQQQEQQQQEQQQQQQQQQQQPHQQEQERTVVIKRAWPQQLREHVSRPTRAAHPMRVFVAQVGPEVLTQDLIAGFEVFGPVKSIHVPLDKDTRQRCTYAFVTFFNPQTAMAAIEAQFVPVRGRYLACAPALVRLKAHRAVRYYYSPFDVAPCYACGQLMPIEGAWHGAGDGPLQQPCDYAGHAIL
jgi:hypothetical protein